MFARWDPSYFYINRYLIQRTLRRLFIILKASSKLSMALVLVPVSNPEHHFWGTKYCLRNCKGETRFRVVKHRVK